MQICVWKTRYPGTGRKKKKITVNLESFKNKKFDKKFNNQLIFLLSFPLPTYYTSRNASGMGDGAASLIVASEEAVKRYSLSPLARIVSWNYVGCEPTVMGKRGAGAGAGAHFLAVWKSMLEQPQYLAKNRYWTGSSN